MDTGEKVDAGTIDPGPGNKGAVEESGGIVAKKVNNGADDILIQISWRGG